MTLFELFVPIAAFAVAAFGIWLLRREARGLDPSKRSTPAE